MPREIDLYLEPYVESGNFSGAVLIASQGRFLYRRAFGQANYELGVPNTPETRFHIASISKPFTAAAILRLVERGRISLDSRVADFVPDFARGSEITVRQLLTHTSGIPNVNDFPEYETASRLPQTPESLVALFKRNPLEFEPGSRYRYSNSNYNVLALMLEKLTGRPYGDALQELVLAPAGLRHTIHDGNAAVLIPQRASGYQPQGLSGIENAAYIDWSAKTGNGSLVSTVDDVYAFDRALLAGKILSPSTLAGIFQERAGSNFGWFVSRRDGRLVVGANGRSPGFVSALDRYVDADLVVIVLSNSYSTVAQSPISTDLARIALGEKPNRSFQLNRVKMTAEQMAPFAGTYRFGSDFYRPNAAFMLRWEREEVLMDWGNGFKVQLVPLGGGTFLDRMFWAQIRAGADGVVYDDGQQFSAKRQ